MLAAYILAYARSDAIALLIVAGFIVLLIAVRTLNHRFSEEEKEDDK